MPPRGNAPGPGGLSPPRRVKDNAPYPHSLLTAARFVRARTKPFSKA
ncbi:MAG: hypothetical protein JWQ62_2565 [Lacunisphaera sp.]|nr:hypothetical protein [Lacunisphaera sp.]